MGHQAIAYPSAVIPRLVARFEPFGVARAVALKHVEKLIPIGLGEIVMPAFLVPFQIGVRDGQAQIFSLRDALIDELLTQLVIAVHLDLPRHGLRRMDRIFI